MRVYRIQHEAKGHGPYVIPLSAYECPDECEGNCLECRDFEAISTFSWILVKAHQDDTHRSPRGIYPREICGFDSMHALEAWFDGYLDQLTAMGYTVAEYDGVNVSHHGNGQVTFDKELSFRLTSATN